RPDQVGAAGPAGQRPPGQLGEPSRQLAERILDGDRPAAQSSAAPGVLEPAAPARPPALTPAQSLPRSVGGVPGEAGGGGLQSLPRSVGGVPGEAGGGGPAISPPQRRGSTRQSRGRGPNCDVGRRK